MVFITRGEGDSHGRGVSFLSKYLKFLGNFLQEKLTAKNAAPVAVQMPVTSLRDTAASIPYSGLQEHSTSHRTGPVAISPPCVFRLRVCGTGTSMDVYRR